MKADEHFNTGDYSEARSEYEEAHTLKPLEQYPEVKIEEIENRWMKSDRSGLFGKPRPKIPGDGKLLPGLNPIS